MSSGCGQNATVDPHISELCGTEGGSDKQKVRIGNWCLDNQSSRITGVRISEGTYECSIQIDTVLRFSSDCAIF